MPKDEKTASLAAAVLLLLSGYWLGMYADARAEATRPALTADEQSKLKKDLINARERQTPHVKAKEGATRSKPMKP